MQWSDWSAIKGRDGKYSYLIRMRYYLLTLIAADMRKSIALSHKPRRMAGTRQGMGDRSPDAAKSVPACRAALTLCRIAL